MPAPVTVSNAPATDAWTQLTAYDVSNNPEYIGLARSYRPTYTLTVSAVSKAAAAEVTSTAHGLTTGQSVTIAGATAGWAGINGDQIITVTGADTFTVAVNSSAFAGDFDGTITATAPRTNQAIWSIQKLYYTGSNPTRQAWADGTTSATFSWDSRATYGYQ